MEPERVEAHPRVDPPRASQAICRGPISSSLAQCDQDPSVLWDVEIGENVGAQDAMTPRSL